MPSPSPHHLPRMRRLLPVLAAISAGVVGLCLQDGNAASPRDGGMSRAEVFRQVTALTQLGAQMFRDPALSASGKLACASCHSPEHAFGPPNDLPVQLGGVDLSQPGLRAVPSLKYLQAVPPFTEHFFESEDEGDESVDNGPTGGLTWDGRADSGSEQVLIPLLSVFEMANASPADVVAKARKAGYANAFRAIFGRAVLDSDDSAFKAIVKAFEVYEQDYATFYPYSSKYDAFLAGKASLTPHEARGLTLFNDPAKGNCAECHISKRANDGEPPQFTDYGMIALGVPRNQALPANADPAYFDMGLCGPLRTDLSKHTEYCGLFRTPSLRNVATRSTFFHNGIYHSLKQVLEFYVQRDTNPERFYPRTPDGTVRKYDDLPSAFHKNITEEAPFNRHPGDRPALDDAEIDDVIAFLQTLTDGYTPTK
jgi:cytochrome c peroxidase